MADDLIRDLADDLIRDLADEPNPTDSMRLAIDDTSYTEAHSVTKVNLFADEVTAREDSDDEIALSVGLNTDYTYKPIETSQYIKTTDFVTAGLTPSVNSACELLDAAIFAMNNKLFLEIFYNFTNAQLLAIKTTPVTIYAALAGYFVNCHDVIGKHNFNATPFSGDIRSATLDFKLNNIKIASLPFALLSATQDTIYKGAVEENVILTPNNGIVATADEDYTSGGGTVRARLLIELLPDDLQGLTPTNCCNTPIYGSFTSADLVADILTITHGLGTTMILGVAITDDSSDVVTYQFTLGDSVGANEDTKISIDFTGVTVTGTWSYYFIAFKVS